MESKYLLNFIEESFAKTEFHYKNLVECLEESEIHDFRVSVRKALPLIELARFIAERRGSDSAVLERGYREIKSYFKKLSELRDIQVQTIHAAEYRGLEQYSSELKRREDTIKEFLQIDIKSWNLGEIQLDLSYNLRAVFSGIEDKQIESYCIERENILRKRVLSLLNKLDRDYDSYHKLRLALKKYRYHIEMSRLEGETDEKLKKYQDKLGYIQDLSVLLDGAKSFGKTESRVKKKIARERAEKAHRFKEKSARKLKKALKKNQ